MANAQIDGTYARHIEVTALLVVDVPYSPLLCSPRSGIQVDIIR
jgi:hypothetical protein